MSKLYVIFFGVLTVGLLNVIIMFLKVAVESSNAKAKPSSRALARRSGADAPALKTAERIKKALATYAIVAWRLLWLTYQTRENPNLPCDTIHESLEWQSLYCHFYGVSLAEEPPSIKQAVIWTAQLRGFWLADMTVFLGSKHSGEDYNDYMTLLLLGSCCIPLRIRICRLMGKA